MSGESKKPNYNVKVSNLLPEQAMMWWPLIEHYFAEACKISAGRVTIEDIKDVVSKGQMMVHLIWDPEKEKIYGAVGSECFEHPRKRVFALTIAGGESLAEWGHLWPAFKHIAKTLGFNQIEVSGRPGWKKYIPGAREIGRTYVEDL